MVLAFLLLPGTVGFVGPARLPARPLLARMSAMPIPDTAPLYKHLEPLLRRAEKRGARVRELTKRWTTMEPAELVEATLVVGAQVVTFEEGQQLLQLAEENAGLEVTTRAYGSLMRLGQAEERHGEVLLLLARARSAGLTPSSLMLLVAMEAAAALADWGAVARLADQYAAGDAAAGAASSLELVGAPEVLEELRVLLDDGRAGLSESQELTRADTQALTLALRAHCERGDAGRAAEVVARMQQLGLALERASYEQLLALATRRGAVGPLAKLRPTDLLRSLTAELEPLYFQLRSQVMYNDEIEAVLLALALVAAAGLAFGATSLLGGAGIGPLAPPPPSADPFAFVEAL